MFQFLLTVLNYYVKVTAICSSVCHTSVKERAEELESSCEFDFNRSFAWTTLDKVEFSTKTVSLDRFEM